MTFRVHLEDLLLDGDMSDTPGSGKLWNDCAIILKNQGEVLWELKECFQYLSSNTTEIQSFQVLAVTRLRVTLCGVEFKKGK